MTRKLEGINIKSTNDLKILKEGGKRLLSIKQEIANSIDEGVSAYEIENLTTKLIKEAGGEPSFKMVPNYSWSTCVNVNEGIVHGIPHKTIVFKKGDIVSVDVGLFYKGFHTDTSLSKGVKIDKKLSKFLSVGEESLEKAIKQAVPGNRVYDISQAMEETLKKNKLSPIKALVGHGIGRSLHEEPQIPCFVGGSRNDSVELVDGMVLAIEVMYTKGKGDVRLDADGWTIKTADGKISALFEDTVSISSKGPLILTNTKLVG